MTAQTAQQQPAGAQHPTGGGEVAVFQKPRLTWHPEIENKFKDLGVTKTTWKALVEAVFPLAQSVDSVVMALSYCHARRLDPFKRVIHIVPMWHSELRRMVDTVWPGIAELRTTAVRTGQYVGKSKPIFGPPVTEDFKGLEVTYPEWCEITVKKMINGQIGEFTAKVWWREAAVLEKKTGQPNSMWRRRLHGQLAKCTEAEGLREAFPEEIGGDLTAEEMEGRTLTPDPDGVYSPAQNTAAPSRPSREEFAPQTEDVFPLHDEVGETVGEFVAAEWAAKLGEMLPEIGNRGDHNALRIFWTSNRDALGLVVQPAAIRDLEDEYRDWMQHCNDAGLIREEKEREREAGAQQGAPAAGESAGTAAPADEQSRDTAAPADGESQDTVAPTASNETTKSNTAEEPLSPTEDPEAWAARTKEAILAATTKEQLAEVTDKAVPFYDALKTMGYGEAVVAIAAAINAKAADLAKPATSGRML